jgi:prepilin signal peptidase PulO-like enzyme (type II secretory pathway)
MILLTALTLFILGAIFGSFAGAQVWRLRAQQLKDDKKQGEAVDETEYKILKKLFTKKFAADRSRCLHCEKQLKWYDLMPIISWLSTAGRCRYCSQPIGRYELAIEFGVGLFFMVSYIVWLPAGIDNWLVASQLIVWLAAGVVLAMLFSYDYKWFLLPNVLNFTLALLGFTYFALHILIVGDITGAMLLSFGGALLIMSGLYGVLYLFSKGAWIGLGDVKLGVGLALFLVDWQLAFLALFLANFIGVIAILPRLMTGKLNRKTQIPFGPFLIVGTTIAVLFGDRIISSYIHSIGQLFI